MAARLASLLPRFVVLPLIGVLATATITFAAERQLNVAPAPQQPTAAAVPQVILVPDVRRQAFVFAKGSLEDAGFAWKVSGPVQGYAANTVVAQAPAPGTRVIDTGAPLVSLTLATNKRYPQKGLPENASRFPATPLKLAGAAVAPPAPAAEAEAAPAAQPAPAAPAKPKAKPAASPKPSPKPKPKAAAAQKRPPAFVVPGAPKEPLDEMPLPDRARELGRYLDRHPKPTSATVNHFLYQHNWIVTGAQFGWWRGAEALRLLVDVDRKAQRAWGIGGRSESLARAALERVEAKSR